MQFIKATSLQWIDDDAKENVHITFYGTAWLFVWQSSRIVPFNNIAHGKVNIRWTAH
jgi:hypothetical protein